MLKAISLGVVAALLAAPAYANQTEDECMAYSQRNNTDPSGCVCLGAAAAKDPALATALDQIKVPADVDAADDATKQAIAQCWPDADASTNASSGQ
ncbi:MAG TPA: hypothetical protein VNH64_03710 [Parvularculaceae bacterium]|nr:hypothetical protein [Parvularculaceae bacterium]